MLWPLRRWGFSYIALGWGPQEGKAHTPRWTRGTGDQRLKTSALNSFPNPPWLLVWLGWRQGEPGGLMSAGKRGQETLGPLSSQQCPQKCLPAWPGSFLVLREGLRWPHPDMLLWDPFWLISTHWRKYPSACAEWIPVNVPDSSTSRNGSSQLDKAFGKLHLKPFPFQWMNE